MKPKIIVYLPVIHKGYLSLFKKYKDAEIFIANQSLIEFIDQEFDYLRKEIRSITPQQAETSLSSLLPGRKISLLGANDLMMLDSKDQNIILPKEDIFIWLKENYLTKSKVTFESTFLRWNRNNTVEEKKIISRKRKTTKAFSNILGNAVKKTNDISELSSDWWRQVGAIVFDENNSKVIAIANNHHLPSPYTPYIDSDPRNSFHKGENIDLSTAMHAEAGLIAYCANKGIALRGKSMFVSTFPCPVCAKQIAASGISKLYYSQGYSVLDGERVLNDARVKIIKLE